MLLSDAATFLIQITELDRTCWAGLLASCLDLTVSDTPPLVLADYLITEGGLLSSGCNYSFDVNGKVTQILP